MFSEILMVMIVMTDQGKCANQHLKMATTASEGSKMVILEVQIVDLESREERFLNILKTF